MVAVIARRDYSRDEWGRVRSQQQQATVIPAALAQGGHLTMHLRHRLAPLCALVVLDVVHCGQTPALAATPSCAGQADCMETSSFVATLSDFRTSTAGDDHVATATVHFQNKLDQPLILSYVSGSGLVADDKGNRYVPGPNSVRGIGAVTGSNVDAKFTLEPGEASDARIEFTWKGGKDAPGTTFDLDLTVQEIQALPGGKYQPGKERVLHFANAGQNTDAAAAPAAAADPCAGLQHCASGGSFIAQVVSFTPVGNPADRHHSLKLNVMFRNITNEPVVLGYKSNSSAAVDNLGNAYVFGRPGTHDTSFSGIGLVTSRAADPSFVLKPGESRNAGFTVTRFNSGGKELGTGWSYDVVLTELEILPSRQVRSGAEHSLHFADLSAHMPAASTDAAAAPADLKKAVEGLKNIFKKN